MSQIWMKFLIGLLQLHFQKMDPVILLLSIALFLIPAYTLLQAYNKRKRIASFIDQLPGPQKRPIFGTSYELLKAPRDSMFLDISLLLLQFYWFNFHHIFRTMETAQAKGNGLWTNVQVLVWELSNCAFAETWAHWGETL